MDHSSPLLFSLGTALIAALVGGLIARFFKLPVLVGFLLAGMAVGPFTPGFIADIETVQSIANLGVVLLMFAVGVHFSLKDLQSVKKTALIAGMGQIFGCIFLGILLGLVLGWGLYGGLFLGCAIALSSTAVMVRVLEEKGELGSSHGAIMLGISVVQDLSLLVMVTLLPAVHQFTTGTGTPLVDVLLALGKAALFLLITVVLAIYAIPALMSRIVKTGSPELFVLTVVSLCLVAATAAEAAGLGHALGAFLAGVVVAESPYSHEVFAQIRPLRDVFASLFFVSIGMLLNPKFLVDHWIAVGSVVLTIIIGKSLISAVAIYLTGWHARVALLAGLGLAQIGEFSFVLAMEGTKRELIPDVVADVILSAALITILLWPFVYNLSKPIYVWLSRSQAFAPAFNRRLNRESHTERLAAQKAKVLVLGGGRVGRYVSDSLRAHDVAHAVIDFDNVAVSRLRENSVPIIFGDASSPDVIEQAKPEKAVLAIVALPEVAITEMAVKTLRQLAPNLPIVVRVRRGIDIPRMRLAGADAVVHGEFESGVEMIRQTLDRLGFHDDEVDSYIEDVRQYRYREE